LTSCVTGSYDDTNALANITIAGWLDGDKCSTVEVSAGGQKVSSQDVEIVNDNGAVYVTGLQSVAKAFGADLVVKFS
jgi:hypothetical protein